MNTRARMTARIHELWAEDPDYPEIVRAIWREFPAEPPSVHDAAWSAAIGQIARRLRLELGKILEDNGVAP
jgi:hypothetical protein